ENAIKYYMSLDMKPDSIFTAADQISTKCLILLHKLGYSIPEDLGLIGFTNTDLAEAFSPSLSTVHQPAYEIGQLAAEKLISLIERKNHAPEFETIMLETNIKARSSSDVKTVN